VSQRDELKKAGVTIDVYVGASTVDKNAVAARIAKDEVSKANSARVDAIVAQGERQLAALELRSAEQSLRIVEMNRQVDRLAAENARQRLAHDVAEGKIDRLTARAMGEQAAIRRRDTAEQQPYLTAPVRKGASVRYLKP
jgi:hypothetical protein